MLEITPKSRGFSTLGAWDKKAPQHVRCLRVGLQGLEPRIAVPETDVLPITP